MHIQEQPNGVNGDATQDRFLGTILGMAIGDAFGMPVAGLSGTTIADFYGAVTEFLPRTFPDGEAVGPGEISDETEIALCIIESVTAALGEIDVENIGHRMAYLARSNSRRWLSAATTSALDGRAEDHEFRLPLVDDEDVGADVLARGIPVGLMHSMGRFDDEQLRADVNAVTRITHGSPLALSLVDAVARSVALAARAEVPPQRIRERVSGELPDGTVRDVLTGPDRDTGIDAARVLREALDLFSTASSFEALLELAVEPGGATDARTSLAAALYGGHHGSSVIPQRFIDDLESRIYVSLAVPWFYRTVAQLRGRAIELRVDFGPG